MMEKKLSLVVPSVVVGVQVAVTSRQSKRQRTTIIYHTIIIVSPSTHAPQNVFTVRTAVVAAVFRQRHGDRPAGRLIGWVACQRAGWRTCGKRVRACPCVRCARAESMPKWVNQCKHGTEVTADSPRARPIITTATGRAESCVYACQLSGHRRPAGEARIIYIAKNLMAHTVDRRNNIFQRRYLLLNIIVEVCTTHTRSA